ncbi:FAD-dependent oxidoreductase [Aeromicrobium sp.]|nr:FAD-dependent oxidoreductase [Candidatus Saccharibacteria bacterium]
MSRKHKHIIVGGGFGGLRVARLLANRDDVDVIIVNPQANFEYHGSLYRSANGTSPLETVIPYREIFADTNIEYRQDFMIDIDLKAKRIKLLSGNSLDYDTVTLALGYEPEYFGIPGMREFSKTLYSLADALELRRSLKYLAEISFHKSTPARVIVAGGGPTGIEVAAAIPYFFELITGDRRVEVTVIEAQQRILGALTEEFSRTVEKSLGSAISIRCGQKVIRATKQMLHIADGPSMPFDIVVWTAGSSANSYFRQRPDLFEVDRKGRAIVDQHLQPTDKAAYVIGDSAAVQYSGTAHAAIEMGGYVAHKISNDLAGKESSVFEPTEPAYAVPTDHVSAVAMDGPKLLAGGQGWELRRKLDLEALTLIMPEAAARSHWLSGESLANMFSPTVKRI